MFLFGSSSSKYFLYLSKLLMFCKIIAEKAEFLNMGTNILTNIRPKQYLFQHWFDLTWAHTHFFQYLAFFFNFYKTLYYADLSGRKAVLQGR